MSDRARAAGHRRLPPSAAAAVVAAALAVGAGAAALGARPAAPALPALAAAYAFVESWPAAEGDSEPIGLAVGAGGELYTVQTPRGVGSGFAALVRRGPDGRPTASFVVRDLAGRELRPLAAAVGGGGRLYVTTEDLLLELGPDGAPRWQAPAGDGRPEFGPAARSLAAGAQRLFGTDLVNGRLLGYGAADGRLELRLGTVGTAAGAYRAPMDVALSRDGLLYVADYGNRRVQLLDDVGNPLARWSVPAGPRAVAVDGEGRVFALLADERVWVLDPTGLPLSAFGRQGHDADGMSMAADIAVTADGRVLIADRGNRRVLVYGPTDGGPQPTEPSPPPPPAPTEPAVRRLELEACPGRPATATLEVTLSPSAPRVDVLLLFDTTGSMEGVIDVARLRALEVAARLAATGPDVLVGVADVRDYPYGRAGLPTDWPYALRGSLSADPAALAAATARMRAGGGGDAPEAYSGAMIAALDDPNVGWRPGARRVLVLLGDSVPRDDDLNEGVAEPVVPGRWAPGLPAWWRDSGPDWTPDTADDLDWTAVLARLRSENVTLVALVSGAAPEALSGRVEALVGYWRDWTARAGPGGSAADVRALGGLPEALAEAVAAAGRTVERLHLEVRPAGRAGWVAPVPAEHRAIAVGAGGATRSFQLTVAPPPDTPGGRYPIDLVAVGDGAHYARYELTLDWRPRCEEPTPTPAEATATLEVVPTSTPTSTPTASPTDTPGAAGSPTASAVPGPAPARRLFLPRLHRNDCVPGRMRKADVVLVLDTSVSMAGPKLEAALEAAASFLTLLRLPDDRAAIVTFDGQARLAAPLSGSRAPLLAALAEVGPAPGTRIDLGLRAALDELTGARARAEATPVVVLLTDGLPAPGTEAAVHAEAGRARALRVTVFAIGLGGDVDAVLLSAVATDPTRYYDSPDAAGLLDIYRRIAGVIPCGPGAGPGPGPEPEPRR